MNKQYISEAFDQLNQMQNRNKNKTKKIIKESASADSLIDLRVDYGDILGYLTLDEKGQFVYVKYNTHTKECVVYQRDSSGLPVIISFSKIPLNIYKRKARREYVDEIPFAEYGKHWYSEAFDQLNQMQNMKTNTKNILKESTRAYELVDLIVDYEDILGYCTEDEKGQDVYVKYNTHTNECVVYQRDASGLPVIISFSTIPINRYKRKEKQEYIDELPATEYGKSVYR